MPERSTAEPKTWEIRVCPVHGVLSEKVRAPSHEACPAVQEAVRVVELSHCQALIEALTSIRDDPIHSLLTMRQAAERALAALSSAGPVEGAVQ